MWMFDVPVLRWGVALLIIPGGTAFLLYGERNFHFVVGLVGIVLGVLAGYVVTTVLEAGLPLRIAGLLAGGGAGILLNLYLTSVNLFLIGAKTGVLAFLIFIQLLFPSAQLLKVLKEGFIFWVFLLPAAIAGGGMAIAYRRVLITVFTSLYGVAGVLVGIGLLTRAEVVRRSLEDGWSLLEQPPGSTTLLLWILMTAGACLVQLSRGETTSRRGST